MANERNVEVSTVSALPPAEGQPPAPPFREDGRFQAGQVLLNRFRIVRPIGRGGMGEVYQAEDLELGTIALKTIRGDYTGSRELFESFRQEVQVARRVTGTQVCRIHELFLLPAQPPHPATAFLTMEFIDGVTLSSKLRSHGPFPLKEALAIALDLCEGLRLIHQRGIVHRDLKSSNVMLAREHGAVRTVLMDFGLAQSLSSTAAEPASGHRAIVGTPEYMAPEQFEAQPVTPATDIYALGIILYELVAGVNPFAAHTAMEAAIRRARKPPPPSSLNSAVPRQWDRIIECCLCYEAADRYQSAAEVARALKQSPLSPGRLRSDRPWLLRAAAAIVLAALAFLGHRWWQARQLYHPGAQAQRWYDSGVAALKEGNYIKATRSFDAALTSDSRFVMAHVRLAEAWDHLDFQGNAQRELLLAAGNERRLNSLDGLRFDAVHASVTGDYPAAVSDYREITNRLRSADEPERSAALVDLGSAYERAGDPAHALASYAQASTLDSQNPSAFMRTAVLEGHQNHVAAADHAFDSAKEIFTREVNEEGLAELDYERGYAANQAAEDAKAQEFLSKALDEAEKIPSVQLEIRSLTQLCTLATYTAGQELTAIAYADRAIQLARDNMLDGWAAEATARRANAELALGRLSEAQGSIDDALKIVHQAAQPRIEAMANLSLANLMNQKHLPEQVIAPAQKALDFYLPHGFAGQVYQARLLIARAQRDQGQFKQALQSGLQLLAVSTQIGRPEDVFQGEETLGSILLAQEDYPDALTHFQKAMTLAVGTDRYAFEELYSSRALWKLGRYAESDSLLGKVVGSEDNITEVAEIRAESLLSRGKDNEASALSKQAITSHPSMVSERKEHLERLCILGESRTREKRLAHADLSAYLADKRHTATSSGKAEEALTLGEIYLALGDPAAARGAAVDAYESFSTLGERDSEIHSLAVAAIAIKSLGDDTKYREFRLKTVDILSSLQHTWPTQAFQTYLSRPDVHELFRDSASPGPRK